MESQEAPKVEMFEPAEESAPTVVKTKKERKKRVLTDEQKKALVARLKAGKEKARLRKQNNKIEGKVVVEKKPRVATPQPLETAVIKEEASTPLLSPIKEEPKVSPKNTELEDLKRQLAELKSSNINNEKEIIKMAIQKEEEKKAKRKAVKKKKEEVAKELKEPLIPKKRYSTYKKSIWNQFS